ncbi:BZ3500_MvSof-1268-A1-R1_Chr3-1g05910 [Microbotryum saponariae]|uniref:BZ3500_MvSof-1268-A1-R1_Chr3-1g05910 protein n=1 Tax=Microbotryum saponariae TaxID=289078 RepID=A0A2X0LIV0_9BASI|nr:BZ3500_MvSof-1268-A1-R1_Chr3-1g05910 [Microbotryum saponariae]SDA05100.1 BZ3501_MvSof-1269-A2-R1_Chr3-1g05580 [Microbotryum saponariae]
MSVRGARVKLCEVQLDDVIAGKYTPPIGLKDFEDYLCFRTKSAENLYFELWLRHYAAMYNMATPSTRSHADMLALGESYRQALNIFFSLQSPLELNVASDLSRNLAAAVKDVEQQARIDPSREDFLPPSAFAAVHHETNESLAQSFKSFLMQSSRNADRNRARFAMFLGALTWVLGLIPTLVCASLGKNRGWRALGFPLWWFGIVVLVGGLKRTCLVIYLFGDNRQLYSWELARETDVSGSSIYGSDVSPILAEMEEGKSPMCDFDSTLKSGAPGSPDSEAAPSTSSRRSSGHFPELNYFRLQRAHSLSDKSITMTATTSGGLYFASAHLNEKVLPKSSGVWAPFTCITEPIVAQAQREIVVAGACYGIAVMVVTGAICMAVPNRR